MPKTPMMTAPIRVPMTPPSPPNRLVPPMTTAAMHSNSTPVAISALAEFMRPVSTRPEMAAIRPMMV